VPVPLCQPTSNGRCTAQWHDVCGERAGKRPLVSYRHAAPVSDVSAHVRRVRAH